MFRKIHLRLRPLRSSEPPPPWEEDRITSMSRNILLEVFVIFLLIKIGFFACPPPMEEVDSLQPAEMKTEVD